MLIEIPTKQESDPGQWYVIHSDPATGAPLVRFRIRAVPAAFRRACTKTRLHDVETNDLLSAKAQDRRLQLNLDTAVYALAEIEGLQIRMPDDDGAKAYSKATGKTIAAGEIYELGGEQTDALKRQFLADRPEYGSRVNDLEGSAAEKLDKLEKKDA